MILLRFGHSHNIGETDNLRDDVRLENGHNDTVGEVHHVRLVDSHDVGASHGHVDDVRPAVIVVVFVTVPFVTVVFVTVIVAVIIREDGQSQCSEDSQ